MGVLLPGAAIALWTFCECCYEDDEEEEQENRSVWFYNMHNTKHTQCVSSTNELGMLELLVPILWYRNLTWQAQVVVWSLAVAMVTALLVLLVMVGLLLGANSWITEGVNRGSTVVRRTIPQVSWMFIVFSHCMNSHTHHTFTNSTHT